MKTNKLKLCLGLLLVFLIGAVSGSLGTKIYFDQKKGQFSKGDHLAKRKEAWMEKLKSELSLSQQQQGEIQKILDKSFGEMRSLRERNRPEMEKIIEDSIALMKENLDDGQKVKLDEMHKKFVEKRKQRHKQDN